MVSSCSSLPPLSVVSLFYSFAFLKKKKTKTFWGEVLKKSGKWRDHPCLYPNQVSPIINILDWCETFVLIDKPILTYYY